MIRSNMPPPPSGPAFPSAPGTQPGQPLRRALLAAVLVIAGGALTGVVGGLIWAAVAPRVQYQLVTLNPPTAYATNPETSAFIAADGWYCVIAVAGGALIGLTAYLFAIRRYGPLPMVGAVLGAIAAGFLAAWFGHEASGGPGFDHLLATSKVGAYLYAPISLGSHGALAFWPLAAAVVAGVIELTGVLKARRQPPSGAVPMPGMESFGMRPYPAGPDRGDGAPDQRAPGYRGEDGAGGQAGSHYRSADVQGFWAPAARPSSDDDRHSGFARRAQNGSPPRSDQPGSDQPGSAQPGSDQPGSDPPGSEQYGAPDGPGSRDAGSGEPPR